MYVVGDKFDLSFENRELFLSIWVQKSIILARVAKCQERDEDITLYESPEFLEL